MAVVQLNTIKPFPKLSLKATPKALGVVLEHIFGSCSEGLWLVGGTALAGYYAEHRKSDDLDLFACDSITQELSIRAIRSLMNKGAKLSDERHTPNYYHVDVKFMNHSFTIDSVLDEHLHSIGSSHRVLHGIVVANLETLFATKVACLVSRCSEKDLFDLDWILIKRGILDIAEIIERGSSIDGGLCIETLLISLQGSILRKDACHFLVPSSPITIDAAYKKIINLRKKLITCLREYEKSQPQTNESKILSQAIFDQKKIKK